MNSIDEDEYKKFEMKLARVVTCAIRQSKGNELKDAISDILSYFSETLDMLRKGEQCVISLYETLSSQAWIPVNNKPHFNEEVIGTDGKETFPCKYTRPCGHIRECTGWHTIDGYCIGDVTLWKKMPSAPEARL